METILQVIHWCAGVVVLSEALNKLERTNPFAQGMSHHARITDGLKAVSWLLLALGAGGVVVTPALLALGVHVNPWENVSHEIPTLAEASILLGFAVLIVRTRVKEG